MSTTGSPSALTPKMEALIEAMYLTATADDDFAAPEREQFVSNVVGLCGGRVGAEDVKLLLLKLKGKAKSGRAGRLKTLAGRLPALADREHAFALACTMALADGVVLDEERQMFTELAAALGISADRADAIFDDIKSLETATD